MSIKGKWLSGILSFFESTTHNTVKPVAPVVFHDDFLGSALDATTNWVLYDSGGAETETLAASVASGAAALTLTAANGVELAGLYFGDQLPLVLNQGLCFEARVRFTVLPAVATTAVIGLCGATNPSIDAVAESIWFRWDFSGLITCETDDTAAGHETSAVTTGVTLVANEWVILRIDCNDTASVKFYVNGQRVCSATTFNCSTAPAVDLQPILRLDKAAAAANLGVMQIDYVTIWQKRS